MKKKTNHKIMKKRNTKKNTKRKMNKRNKRNKSLKRRKTLKSNKKIRFTRKKLYGGAGSGAGSGSAPGIIEKIKESITTIMSTATMNFLSNGTPFDTPDGKIFENLDPFKVKINLHEGGFLGTTLKFPGTGLTDLLDTRLYELFRFWHKYGCVLSDNTLYKLYINLFFHSIYVKIASEQDSGVQEGSEELYNEIISEKPIIRDLCIVFYKLKHLCDDLHVVEADIQIIWNFVQYILEILTNIVIFKYFGMTLRSPGLRPILTLVDKPTGFIGNIEKMVPLLREYIDSGIFSGYIQRDYGEFNAAMVTGVFHLDGVGRYSLDELKIKLEGTGDPILELNKGDTHPNTPTEEGVPEPEPA